MAFTLKQKATLRKHASHHSTKHMKAMKLAMNKGTSFTKAHKSALKKGRCIMAKPKPKPKPKPSY